MKDFELKKIPDVPGVYLMKGAEGAVLYVGKAKRLRQRLRSYFSETGDGRAQIRFLMARVQEIETIVTDTEKEALILENTLIKKHRPRYNINLRDDKTYVSLRLDPREDFPALEIVRQVRRDGALYFGPFSSSSAVRETLKEIYRIFPLRHYPLARCRARGRPCLFYQIGQCSAPCHGRIDAAAYGELVDGVTALLSGRESEVLDRLRRRMLAASGEMRFEEAARLRDQIRAIEQTVERQKVVTVGGGDQDVLGWHRQGGEVEVALLFVRQGQLLARRVYAIDWKFDEDELLGAFLQEYYSREVVIPDQLLLPRLPQGAELLAEWLSERKGRKVEVVAPQRGARRELVALAERNAQESFRERGSRREAREAVLEGIQRALQLRRFPRRMECYDISNVQGSHSVGSQVVALDGEPAPGDYRQYQIRSVEGSDDYAALAEVLRRRLSRGLREESLPDFILIDGGKGQLGVLTAVLAELELGERIDCAGIAKSRVLANVRGKAVERSEERFFLPGRKNPVRFPAGSPELFMLERLRDEAHRFALSQHRKRRGKALLGSVLLDLPGIGPARRKLLLKHFGSLRRLREAPLDALLAVPGFPEELARRLFAVLREQAPPEGAKSGD
ncbi:excinuclease ABC subunit UvrC [Trichloromonas acetexigens]|uniref:excinuclease ABC subunit UvrC n=1 Tax=Trichloromonas acetexigens TaxID=38815 RepID=UPI001F119034|nr:excinuclease ABC subunit UvrC [Desulfuromonas acetexigens]